MVASRHRLQTRSKRNLTDKRRQGLFAELLEGKSKRRKKHFAALRAKEKRIKPPTKAQKKSIMSTYLKHMGGYKHSQLKNKSFDEIQKLFDKEMTREEEMEKAYGDVQDDEVAFDAIL
ncbi:hypothetical protein Tco_1402801 [Tanacetum coccineum]